LFAYIAQENVAVFLDLLYTDT